MATFDGSKKPSSHPHFKDCPKNPGHENFIPSSQFNISHLPTPYRDIDLVTCVKTMSELSVFIIVKNISKSRPEFAPGTDRPYGGSKFRGTNRMLSGSGWIHTVYRFPDKYNFKHKSCPCKECLTSDAPKTHFACIAIYSASHIVFDDYEGEHTLCYLFYNEACSPKNCQGAVELRGIWRVFSDIITDRCLLIHVTHDMELADRLDTLVWNRDSAKEKFINKCLLYNPYNDPLVILVSHPHGCSTHVTVGLEKEVVDKEAGRVQYVYDTPTCQGCSGGKILVIWRNWELWGCEHTHSRKCQKGELFNYSAHGFGYLRPIRRQIASDDVTGESPTNDEQDQDSPASDDVTGESPTNDEQDQDSPVSDDVTGESPTNDEQDQDSPGSPDVEQMLAETELHSKWMFCTINPGHENFIPIHEFNEDHLTPGLRHLVQPVKALGNIVGHVKVKTVSKERPKTFPGTDIKYPRSAQLGSCWVYKVVREFGRCPCEKCQKSQEPKTSFAYIIIHTAAHVVFDDSEREHTICYLFFDTGDTLPSSKEGVVELAGMARVWGDADKDVCKMLHVTHDPDVIDRVENAVNEWERARSSLECQRFIDGTADGEGFSYNVSDKTVAIIVSHPHGCSKQVSLGACVRIDNRGGGRTVFKYTTPTCPGSSGAYLFVAGRVRKSWDDHEHVMTNDNNNYSN